MSHINCIVCMRTRSKLKYFLIIKKLNNVQIYYSYIYTNIYILQVL